MVPKLSEWNIVLPDKELACAPLDSEEGRDYFGAMAAAANFAWANRHLITHNLRQAWKNTLGPDVELNLMYDISHNIGKKEVHKINGKDVPVLVHRKGATRSFGPGQKELPLKYQNVGQPVLIPGTMATSSYVLAGTKKSMEVAFGSTCHGAGRMLSRRKAKEMITGPEVLKMLQSKGIIVRCDSYKGLAEEAPLAYKDVDNVVNVVHNVGLAKKVLQLKPVAVIKGG
jgi:tRNA-splicing ligase RtcB